MKQKLREERGITLVALIITIIVLIILAAVTINAAFKSNFIEMATNGTANYANAQSYEQRMMDDLSDKLDGVIDKISKIEEEGNVKRELENFKQNPDAYKHPDQSETNKDRAIGTDGKPVNMDLWKYTIKDEGQKELYLGKVVGTTSETSYIGEIIDGKIQGTIPQYVNIEGKEGIYTVTDMFATFSGCSRLVEAPEIPNSVTSMNNTFIGTGLVKAPEIPSSVIEMEYTFAECYNLVEISEIPESVTYMGWVFANCSSLVKGPKISNSVKDMRWAFRGCTSLKKVDLPNGVENIGGTFYECTSLEEVLEIPLSVIIMGQAFSNCSSLEEAPEIPANVTNMSETFSGCTSLKGNIKINSSNVSNVSNWSFNNPITIQVLAGSTTYEKVNAAYGSDPNITIETF